MRAFDSTIYFYIDIKRVVTRAAVFLVFNDMFLLHLEIVI